MASLTLTLAAMAVFGGGSGADLANSIAEATGAPVVIECGSSQRFDRFEYNPEDANEMARVILKSAKLRRAPGIDHAYHWPGLPSWHFAVEVVQQLAKDRDRVGTTGFAFSEPIRDGKVTLKTERGTMLLVSSLENMKFAKPMRVDPFFTQIGVAANVNAMPERDFLNLVAKAVGAKVRTTRDGLSFVPSGVEIQKRALTTIAEVMKTEGFAKRPAYQKAQLDLSRAAIASAGAAQIESLFEVDGASVKLVIGPDLRQAAMRMLRAMTEMEAQNEQTAQQNYTGPPDPNRQAALSANSTERFRNLHPQLLGYATMSRGFNVSLELATVDGLGRPGAPIRVP